MNVLNLIFLLTVFCAGASLKVRADVASEKANACPITNLNNSNSSTTPNHGDLVEYEMADQKIKNIRLLLPSIKKDFRIPFDEKHFKNGAFSASSNIVKREFSFNLKFDETACQCLLTTTTKNVVLTRGSKIQEIITVSCK